MFKKMKQHLQQLRAAKAGERFQAYYRERHGEKTSVLRRCLVLITAGFLMLIGLVLLPAPGPGMLVIAAGAALMAGESRAVARLLDRAELAARGMWQRVRGTA